MIAYATRSGNDLCTDAGIVVRDSEPPYADLAWWAASGIELDGEDGGLDERGADEVLRELGFRRTSRWILSGGQWAAGVERA